MVSIKNIIARNFFGADTTASSQKKTWTHLPHSPHDEWDEVKNTYTTREPASNKSLCDPWGLHKITWKGHILLQTILDKLAVSKAFNRYFIFVSTAGYLFFYLQAFKIFDSRSATSLSKPAFILSFLSIVHWVLYGLVKKLPPVTFSSTFGLIGVILVLIGIFLYQ